MIVGRMFDKLRRVVRRVIAPDSSLLTRNALKHYLFGSGIEIGALHRPLKLAGLPIKEIRYVDRRPTAELRELYSELKRARFIDVDVIDDGERLATFQDRSLDFIIANHFIEHAKDPIGTIENWLCKLRSGGVIFLTVPDKAATFDARRPLTPLTHLIEDHRASPEERLARDREHFEEWVAFVEQPHPDQAQEWVEYLIRIDYSIHFHTFTLASFLQLIDYLIRELHFPISLIGCADTLHNGDEFVVVLRRA